MFTYIKMKVVRNIPINVLDHEGKKLREKDVKVLGFCDFEIFSNRRNILILQYCTLFSK